MFGGTFVIVFSLLHARHLAWKCVNFSFSIYWCVLSWLNKIQATICQQPSTFPKRNYILLWKWTGGSFRSTDSPRLKRVPEDPAQIELFAQVRIQCRIHTYNQLCVYAKWSPAKIQTPAHCNMIGRCRTASGCRLWHRPAVSFLHLRLVVL
jgi:hypothetical protein